MRQIVKNCKIDMAPVTAKEPYRIESVADQGTKIGIVTIKGKKSSYEPEFRVIEWKKKTLRG